MCGSVSIIIVVPTAKKYRSPIIESQAWGSSPAGSAYTCTSLEKNGSQSWRHIDIT